TVGLAPGYTARTVIVGGETSGYSLTGSAVRPISPAARMMTDRTTANTGRSMKKREKRTRNLFRIVLLLSATRLRRRGGEHGARLCSHLHSRSNAEQSVDHDLLAGCEAALHDTEAIHHAPHLHGTVFERAVCLEHEDELAILIGADGLVLHHRRRVICAV